MLQCAIVADVTFSPTFSLHLNTAIQVVEPRGLFFLENSTRITVAGTCFSIKHPRSDAADEVDHFCKYHSCSLVQMVTTGP